MTRSSALRLADAADVANPNPASLMPDLDDVALLARLMSRRVEADAAAHAARRLLDRFDTVPAVLSADLVELTRVGGVGPEASADLKLIRLVCERLARCEASRRPVISSWTSLLAYVRIALAGAPREQFRVLFLDHGNRLMLDEVVADGTVDHAPVYPREVVRRALEVCASALVLVHNHPSGDPTPSRADIEMTRKVVDAACTLGVKVHDHLVVGREGTASFKALGLI